MTTYVYRPDHPRANANGMIDKDLLFEEALERAACAAPHVILDTMAPTRHMADGKYYTSKSKFRAVTRAHGCVEIGNELPALLKPRKPVELDRAQRRGDIARAIHDVRNNGFRREE